MLKKLFAVLAVILAVVLVLCWIYLPSFSRYHELRREKDKVQKRIDEIDSQIRTLTDEKYLLQNDVTYLEKVIREELGFVKPGEIIYEMITKKDAEGPAARTPALAAEEAGPKNSDGLTPSVFSPKPKTLIQNASSEKTAPAKTSTTGSSPTQSAPSKRRPR